MWDPEAGAWQPIYGPLFTDSETRMGFVEKTLGLVLLQLLITVGASALFRYWEPARVSPLFIFLLTLTPCLEALQSTRSCAGADSAPDESFLTASLQLENLPLTHVPSDSW